MARVASTRDTNEKTRRRTDLAHRINKVKWQWVGDVPRKIYNCWGRKVVEGDRELDVATCTYKYSATTQCDVRRRARHGRGLRPHATDFLCGLRGCGFGQNFECDNNDIIKVVANTKAVEAAGTERTKGLARTSFEVYSAGRAPPAHTMPITSRHRRDQQLPAAWPRDHVPAAPHQKSRATPTVSPDCVTRAFQRDVTARNHSNLPTEVAL
ncbi:hypothetical protein EVAR_32484_1 [Eumeta japonica]|uniref:Uncharacterized protein n=1 Tax=Eumeta variegata TaxID=151549 RepID=A0A4C1VLY7_EUMVA|nr:hypothetical protein EVAR_32484_1 [Eumeta japonica]